ncbi:MFS transporter [Microbacterium allomyrinae]|uniref:MFS transporter n=1 Tax=Microbacterium allomyrinae TaxID=2830666 RepID=A0A9X1S3Z7_9MICO|nr:MFS transporter [Microbacterium allomyrinae]MCC2032475.1 MFS transporter [Microbacterium allomyrinae]
MAQARDITRTLPFWLMFSVSTLGGITNSATTPTIPVYVADVLGGGSELSGLLISLSALTSIIAMPLGGLLADRHGYRVVAVSGIVVSAAGLALLAAVPALWAAVISRLLFGLGNAAAMTLTLTWLIALAPPAQRGKSLSIFGLSVWLGLALGPQLAATVSAAAGPRAVFMACVGLELVVCVLFFFLPQPARHAATTSTSPIPTVQRRGLASLWEVFRAVWVPGAAAAAAWCGEGLMLGFLIVHLGAAGLPPTGVFGAASVFGVFAVSVIAARIVLARMPDRIGPLRSAAISLVLLCAGLTVIAFAGSFLFAAAGAVLMGIGFSPLYPSLTMLAARGLRSRNRALGLGLFGSFTSVGYASGALVGGLVLASTSSMWAFVLVAGLQLAALAVLTIFTPDQNPRPRLDPGESREPLP